MIELTDIPEVIYKASHGDTFTVNGDSFMFEVGGGDEGSGKGWLTKLPEEDHPFVHLRDVRGVALMSRKDMVELLQHKQFIIY